VPVAAELSTISKDARDFFNSGMNYISRRDHVGRELLIAVRQFELSVTADPEFALGWSRLGTTLLALTRTGIDTRETTRNNARRAVQRALALDPELPEARLALAQLLFTADNNPEAALRELERAAAAAPAGSDLWMTRADLERRMGHLDQAIDSARRATSVGEAARLEFEALVETSRRNFDRAELLFERTFELYPDNAQTQRFLATIPLNRDGKAHGLAALARSPVIDEHSRASAGWFAALWDGDRETALEYLEQIRSGAKVRGFGAFNIPVPLAQAQTLRAFGEQKRAEDLFRSVIEPTRSKLAENPGNPELLTELAEALVGIGELEAGVEVGRQVLERAETSHDVIFTAVARLEIITRVLIPAGQLDPAIAALDRYLSHPGPWSIEGLMPHPLIRPIRDEPGFLSLVEKHKRNLPL
jgi:tetratricopeptide (TPR) repeat protein